MMNHTEVQRRKDYIYKILLDNPLTGTDVVKFTGYPEKSVKHYLRTMRIAGYILYEEIFIDGKRTFLNRANKNKPYKMTFRFDIEEKKEIEKRKQEQKILLEEQYQQSLTSKRTVQITENRRIVRLLDAPLERAPRTRKHVDYGIGSSFSMMDSY